jgi:hypothetical protein
MAAQFAGCVGARLAVLRFDADMLDILPACAGRSVAYYPPGSWS